MLTIRSGVRSAPFALLLAACGDGPTRAEGPAILQAAPATLALTEAQPLGTVFLTSLPASGRVAWSIASKSDWLTLSADSGTVRGTSPLNVTAVVPAEQNPGPMSGHVEFAWEKGRITVPVTMTVLPSAHVVISPASVSIAADSDTGTVTLINEGHGGVSWRATSSVPWLTPIPSAGFLASAQQVILKIAVRRASLAPGTNTGSIGLLSGVDVSPVPIPVTVASP